MAGGVGSDEDDEWGGYVHEWVGQGGDFEAGEGAVAAGYGGEDEELGEHSDCADDCVEEADSLGAFGEGLVKLSFFLSFILAFLVDGGD